MSKAFKIKSKYKPAGDQPEAIKALVAGLKSGTRYQTLLGVTGSGKTFTAANVIEAIQKPTLVIAHNKTLAAQLAQEYKEFFPDNAVHYFVSYYDYYQPEAYMPVTDTYIEKEAQINEEIERLRHASTQALLTRRDVIIIASVSCIYGLGSPVEYEKVHMRIEKGMSMGRTALLRSLIAIHFDRTPADLSPGLFRAIANHVEIMPVNERLIYRVTFAGETISDITVLDATTREVVREEQIFFLFPAKHFITNEEDQKRALKSIQLELDLRLVELEKEGKMLEAERLKRRTRYDLALIREVGYCNGIENYSRHFSGKNAGDPPDTLLSYFLPKDGSPADFLTIVDESHVTIPQIGGMQAGDASRKQSLVDHGFRLPSAKDNRPLTFSEFTERVGDVLFTSATPGVYEKKVSGQVVEQVIRPTGLIDPEITIKPVAGKGDYKGQVADFLAEAEKVVKGGGRVIATTLTKKMAEDMATYVKEKGITSAYLHSDIDTLERIEILSNFRRGKFDCLIGVNLLREGLDLPELEYIGVLDADKEGFLRSETSLIQIIGRAARNVAGHVTLYADHLTGSIERAVAETNRRRAIQVAYNTKHGITPKTIIKKIHDITETLQSEKKKALAELIALDQAALDKNPDKVIKDKEKQMDEAVQTLDFETAALLRDEIAEIRKILGETPPPKKKRIKGAR